jgi:DnaK suppressor protein
VKLEETNRLRTILEEELASIERQLKEFGTSGAGETFDVESDEGFADSAQATAERSSLIGMVEQLHENRKEVLAALASMDAGTYGKCERCGRDIPFERLEAVPATLLCVDCKQLLAS